MSVPGIAAVFNINNSTLDKIKRVMPDASGRPGNKDTTTNMPVECSAKSGSKAPGDAITESQVNPDFKDCLPLNESGAERHYFSDSGLTNQIAWYGYWMDMFNPDGIVLWTTYTDINSMSATFGFNLLNKNIYVDFIYNICYQNDAGYDTYLGSILDIISKINTNDNGISQYSTLYETHNDDFANIGLVYDFFSCAKDKIESGVNENPKVINSLSIYPNPANEKVNIKLNASDKAQVSVNVSNLQGQLIETIADKSDVQPGDNTYEWDCSRSAPGIYSVNINIGGKIISNNVIIGR